MSGQRLTIDRQLGVRVRVARLVADLSRVELASRIGVTVAQVARFETGEDRISSEQLTDIAMALDQTISFFFKGWIDVERPVTDTSDSPTMVQGIPVCGPDLADDDGLPEQREPAHERFTADWDQDNHRFRDAGRYLQ